MSAPHADFNAASPAAGSAAGMCSFAVEVFGAPGGHRHRVILSNRFVIGRDPSCDLCLDLPELPPVGWVLRRTATGLEVESLDDRNFYVNGVAASRAVVADGDELRIGSILLRPRLYPVRFDVVADSVAGPHRPVWHAFANDQADRTDAEVNPDVAEPTAEELADLIAREEAAAEEFDRRRRAGLKSLLAAAGDRRGDGTDERLAGSKTVPTSDALSQDTPAETDEASVDAPPSAVVPGETAAGEILPMTPAAKPRGFFSWLRRAA